MKYSILIMLLMTGCARNACELSVDNLQLAPKIPKAANIEIGDSIMADDGGHEFLKNYVTMSKQVNSIKENCTKQ